MVDGDFVINFKSKIIGWFRAEKAWNWLLRQLFTAYFCNMIGIVLSGGKSSRMGADKGMLQLAGKSWAGHAYEKLSALLPECYLSVRQVQVPYYDRNFDHGKLIIDDASLGISGPLLALLSGHIKFPDEDIFVIACDMVNMDARPIRFLLQQKEQQPLKECWLYYDEDGMQPLLAIYSSALLQKVLDDLQKGLLKKFSVKHIIDISDSLSIPVPVEWESCFVNFNSAEDLAALSN